SALPTGRTPSAVTVRRGTLPRLQRRRPTTARSLPRSLALPLRLRLRPTQSPNLTRWEGSAPPSTPGRAPSESPESESEQGGRCHLPPRRAPGTVVWRIGETIPLFPCGALPRTRAPPTNQEITPCTFCLPTPAVTQELRPIST